MTTSLSEHARFALERLHESSTANWFLRTAILSGDPTPQGAAYSLNWRLYRAFENFLGAQQVTHAADALNSYCQSILAEILKVNPTKFTELQGLRLGKTKPGVAEAIELLESHRAYDDAVRIALRDNLKCEWSPESDIIVKLPNKIIHQGGHDPNHEVEKEIASKNGVWCDIYPVELKPGHVPVQYTNDNYLVMNAEVGYWACRHVENHIHLMDQNICHVFKLSRKRHIHRSLPWKYTARKVAFSTGPGISLPITAPAAVNTPSVPEVLTPYSDYSMAPPKEKSCAQTWLALRKSIHEFVFQYSQERDLFIRGRSDSRPGQVLGHTIQGHDISLEYELVPKDSPDIAIGEWIGIRLRQRDFTPFVTIWGTNSVMSDIHTTDLSDELKNVLRDCIDTAFKRGA